MLELMQVSNSTMQNMSFEKTLFELWIEFLDTSTETVKTYSKSVKLFVNWLADKNISQPTKNDIVQYKAELVSSGKSPNTIQTYLISIRQFFSWLDEEGLYKNIASNVKGVKIDEGFKKDYLSVEQVKNILNNTDTDALIGKRDYAMFSLAVTCGLRTIEIHRADIKDITLSEGEYVLYIQGKGKTEKSRYVKVADEVKPAIDEYLNFRFENSTFDDTLPLFTSTSNNNHGERMTTTSISRIIKGRMIDAGYNSKRLTAHSTRHTAAMINMENGGTELETQNLLGHSKIDTTRIYTHMIERKHNNSERRISSAIFR